MKSLVKRLYPHEKGLTAIELAVVVGILAILAAIVAGSLTGMNLSARGAAQVTDISEVQKAVDRWVGEQPASRYPVSTPVIVDSSNVVVASATPAANGLPQAASSLYTRMVFSDRFTNPEGVSKSFVPGYMARVPKFGGDSPNPWVIDEKGTVKVLQSYASSAAFSPLPSPTSPTFTSPLATPTPAVTATSTPTASSSGSTNLVSRSSDGTLGNGVSNYPSISADGRYVAFVSDASNLVSGDTNNAGDIFIRDRQTGQTTRISVDSSGNQGNGSSEWPSISADGRYVAFVSDASNLVSGDTNNAGDIFIRDRQTGQTTRISVDSSGNQGNDWSYAPSISADGHYVAFFSNASNLVPGDTNGDWDVFVHDRQTGQTTRVSVDSSGNQANSSSDGPSISADGRYVTFYSTASNLVADDTNDFPDIFVRDIQTGQTTRVSLDSAGNQGNNISYVYPSISADGRYVAFWSLANNLVAGDTNGAWDVFVHDRQTGQTTRISVDSSGNQGNDASYNRPSISADGRYVAFGSYASNLVPTDTNGTADVFVRDIPIGQTTRVSVDSSGNQGNGSSEWPSISADGRYVAFASSANTLVPDDTNGTYDIFIHSRW